MSNTDIKGLNAWLDLINGSGAVVLNSTLMRLNEITANEESSANELAKVVMEDASLTTQVIKVANTAHFNPTSQSVTTVSRAILNIGFNTIKSICISIKVLEALLKDNPSATLVETLADSLHSAIQARNICVKMNSVQKEEVFVTTILLHLAELLVLSSGEPCVQAFDHEIKPGATLKEKDRAAEKVIGVSFTRLGQALVKHWRLGDGLLEVLQPGPELSRRAEAVLLGDDISRVIKLGTESAEYKDLIKRICLYTGKDEKLVCEQLRRSAKEAEEVAIRQGSKKLVDMIPSADRVAPDGTSEEIKVIEPDQAFQLATLQELNRMMMEGSNMNSVFGKVLQGLHKGVGLERVALAIFDVKREGLGVKYALGQKTSHWPEHFRVRFEKSQNGFLFNVFQKGSAVWVGGPGFDEHSRRLSSDFPNVTGVKSFFIAPLKADNRSVGFMYGDLGLSRRPLTDVYFNGFRHFCQQANMCLTMLAKRK